jgi:hypothetical protein
MQRSTKILLPLLLLSLNAAPCVAADDDASAQRLLGYWLCESGDCPDEALEFADNDGVHTYNSWLHDRPSAVDGRWSLEGKALAIECCEDLEYHYTVVDVSDDRLVLQDVDTPSEETVLRRPPPAGRAADAPAEQATPTE